ncbi:precorrin-3B synthase [Thioclava sp. FR2]|uniref:precorrin-3B synthase n=1 Tax=Thioclava sp. FR2 TaxID=3445780 RepID=UPI003EC08482
MSGAGDFIVQGWCPGALRPMMSGDGLVVRVRPNAGRLTQAQAAGIAAAARAHGNGLIDLSARANVQLRGVTEESHPKLIEDLRVLGLIDADVKSEARRNLLVTPFADQQTDDLAHKLAAALVGAPELPGKFGFAVDTGTEPVLSNISADIRLERDSTGCLILRCDGAELGAPVSEIDAPARALELAHWFVSAGGVKEGRGRMAALIGKGKAPTGPLAGTKEPAPARPEPSPGLVAQGAMVGFEFGQMEAETLARLARLGSIRVTPWRMLLVEGLTDLPGLPGLILDPDDPLLRVRACTGSPSCVQALGATRPIARRLAPQMPRGAILHVSGCAKGCAHPGIANLTLIATANGFDLVKGGTAQDSPMQTSLPEAGLDLRGLA